MQHTIILASLLAAAAAASGSASHHHQDLSRSAVVTLRGTSEKAFNLPEPLRRPVSARPHVGEPVSEVELTLGENIQNESLRCQILDESYEPIVVLRGENTDITFADGGKGPWTLREPTVVKKVVCDPHFEQIQKDDDRLQVSVLLQSQNPEVGINFDLSGVIRNEVEVQEPTAFETVTLKVSGELVDPALRCQIVGADGAITVLRDDNVKQTFSDAGKGAWTLQQETVVQNIICDPDFQNGDA